MNNPLYTLAQKYAEVTEAFDRCICTGVNNGVAIPNDGHEAAVIRRFAAKLNDHFVCTLVGLDYTEREWEIARRCVLRANEPKRPHTIHES
jgi:hypothetical protein